ncbi:hypothetical protein J2S46_001635 [Kitasatospora herbaricolor]|nr:hypothetical protein [Kitasatospora herbaricolor]
MDDATHDVPLRSIEAYEAGRRAEVLPRREAGRPGRRRDPALLLIHRGPRLPGSGCRADGIRRIAGTAAGRQRTAGRPGGREGTGGRPPEKNGAPGPIRTDSSY